MNNEIFDDRPAPWYVESHRTGGASVVDANHCTVLTCNGTELAAFIADAANAFATDADVFTAVDNNQDKIGVLTIQRDAARALASALKAENDRLCAELSACIAGGNDYAGAILADDEAGMMLAAGQGG